jgi:hypothetical protein
MENLEHHHVSHDDNIAIFQRGPLCRYDFGHDKRGQPNRRKPEQSLNINSLGSYLQELILIPLPHRGGKLRYRRQKSKLDFGGEPLLLQHFLPLLRIN